MKGKLIIYDANCKVCLGLRDLMLAFRLIEGSEARAYQKLDPEVKQQVNPANFRNEMALIDNDGGATLYGAVGVAFIFSEKLPPLKYLFRIPFFFRLFRFLYKTLAFNRYIIATPKHSFISCDCYPESVLKFRLSFLVITYALSVFLTALFGISVREMVGVATLMAAGQMLLIAGTGWVLQMLLTFFFLERAVWLEYLGHLGSIMVAGLLVLVPGIAFNLLTGIFWLPVPLLSVVVSSGLMLYLHHQRAKYLGISISWTISWFILLQTTATFWVINFDYKF